jgi:hypothetical protein
MASSALAATCMDYAPSNGLAASKAEQVSSVFATERLPEFSLPAAVHSSCVATASPADAARPLYLG